MSDTPHETPVHHTEPDDWHQHTPDEGAPQVEHTAAANPTALAITFIAMILGVAFVIVVLVAYFNNYVSTIKAEKQEGVTIAEPFEASKAEALAHLNAYGWVDHQTVHIPVSDAMDRVVARYASAAPINAEGSAFTNAD
mgnify:CR=1 FL=1|jgi:hypothetical protein